MLDKEFVLDLQLFDEGAAGTGTGAAAAGTEGTEAAVDGQGAETAGAAGADEAKAAEELQAKRNAFEARIKGEDKTFFDERVQNIVNQRFKETKKQEADLKSLQTRSEKQQQVLNLLGSRYQDVDPSDPDAVMAALEKDDAMWERYAEDLGIPVDVAKRLAKAERENAEVKRRETEAANRRKAEETFSRWNQEAKELQKLYENFDLQAEANDPATGERFRNMLRSGVPVKDAYQTIHMDELMSGAIQTATRVTEKRTTDKVRARGMRPDENGLNAGGAAVTKLDPSKLTNEQLADLHRRALAGEEVKPFG